MLASGGGWGKRSHAPWRCRVRWVKPVWPVSRSTRRRVSRKRLARSWWVRGRSDPAAPWHRPDQERRLTGARGRANGAQGGVAGGQRRTVARESRPGPAPCAAFRGRAGTGAPMEAISRRPAAPGPKAPTPRGDLGTTEPGAAQNAVRAARAGHWPPWRAARRSRCQPNARGAGMCGSAGSAWGASAARRPQWRRARVPGGSPGGWGGGRPAPEALGEAWATGPSPS
jgi:hypothetical protein